MRPIAFPLPLIGVMFLVACASTPRDIILSVESQPAGAYLTHPGSGKSFGVTPIRMEFKPELVTTVPRVDGCYVMRGAMEVKWVSGATARIDELRLCGGKYGPFNITFSRPASYPDLERDLRFELDLRASYAQQQQAQSAKDAATAAWYRATAPAPARAPVNCTSTQIGYIVQTNCY